MKYFRVITRGIVIHVLLLIVAGKSTGIVTNTRITHATPAALYGHSPSRYWEDDSKVPAASRKSCKDLARQLIENDPGRNINVSRLYSFYVLVWSVFLHNYSPSIPAVLTPLNLYTFF